jgi:uncharacterized protein (TIGR02145 family)
LYAQNTRITGQLIYDNTNNTPLKEVKVYLKSPSGSILDSSITTITGYYHFDNVTAGQYKISAQSNAIAGGINNIDAQQILKHFTGYINLVDLPLKAADVNGNNYINSTDAFIVAKLFVGFISSFDAGTWYFEQPTVLVSGTEPITQNIKGICIGDVNQSYLPEAVPGIPCPGLPAFEYGGQTYNTVQIGSQCWMKENLNIGIYIISENTALEHSDVGNNGVIEKYCYNNDPANCDIYGGLYDWNEMMQYSFTSGSQGICPSGWHIPTNSEFTTLLDGLGGQIIAGGKLKESGINHWGSPNIATNTSGFSAYGGGMRDSGGGFYYLNIQTLIATSSTWTPPTFPRSVYLQYNSVGTIPGQMPYSMGYSVRCIKN